MRIGIEKTFRIKQYYCLDRDYHRDTRLKDFFDQPVIDLNQIQKLIEIRDLCGSVGAEFILVYPPKSQRYLNQSTNTEYLLSTTIGAIEPPEPLAYDTTLLADDFHPNCQGNTKFTNHLTNLISGNHALQQP